MNFKGDMVIRANEITLQDGLREMPVYLLAENGAEEKEIIAVIGMAIEDLQAFLGFTKTMNAKQIFDTAEFILEQYPNLSIKSIVNCFKMIKKSEAPFNERIYGGLSGRQIMEALHKYHELIDEFQFGEAQYKIAMDKLRDINKNKIEQKFISIAAGLNDLRIQVKERGLGEAAEEFKNLKKQ